jgi:hypothetical protein
MARELDHVDAFVAIVRRGGFTCAASTLTCRRRPLVVASRDAAGGSGSAQEALIAVTIVTNAVR